MLLSIKSIAKKESEIKNKKKDAVKTTSSRRENDLIIFKKNEGLKFYLTDSKLRIFVDSRYIRSFASVLYKKIQQGQSRQGDDKNNRGAENYSFQPPTGLISP